MLNAPEPRRDELPSSAQLLRSTLIALLVASALLVFVVLPAEYGIDPTGLGDVVGLKRMGEIKTQLADEANEPESVDIAVSTPSMAVESEAPVEAIQQSGWTDATSVTIAPDEAVELKLVMAEGARAEFDWSAAGGSLNYNIHGDGEGRSVEYGKGRDSWSDAREIVAAFDGHHGCFWRNRSGATVELVFRTRGDYTELKRTR